MANDLGFLKVWANANKSKQTTKRSLSEFLNEPEYDLILEDGTNLGKVGFSAYQAIKENRLDSYTPYNEEEKSIISNFRQHTHIPLQTNDGKEIGKVSYDGYVAISNGNLDGYKPKNEEEKKTIEQLLNYSAMSELTPEERAVFDKYGLSPISFSDDDFKKWAESHNFEHRITGGLITEYKWLPKAAPGWNPWKTLTTDEEEADKEILERFVEKKNVQANAKNFPIITSAITVATAPVRGIAGAVSTAEDSVKVALGKDVTTTDSAHSIVEDTNLIRGTVTNEYASKWFGGASGKLGNYGALTYNGLMSIGDTVVTSLATRGIGAGLGLSGKALATFTSNATSGLLASTSGASTIIEKKKEGLSDGKAVANGLAAATAEFITEKISLDLIFKTPSSMIKKGFISFLAESTEEMTSDVLTKTADYFISGDDSTIKKNINKYIQSGMTKKEAIKQATTDSIYETLSAGLIGGLSGIAMASAYHGFGKSEIKRLGADYRVVAADIIQSGLDSPENSTAYKHAKKLSAKGIENITDYELGLQHTYNVEQIEYEQEQAEKVAKKTKSIVAEQTTATETPVVVENATVEQTTPVEVEQRNTFTEELDEIASTEMPSVSVGETFVDGETNNIIKVVSRDDNATAIEITTPSGKKETKQLSNKTADTLAVDDKYSKVETTAETPAEKVAVVENATTTETVTPQTTQSVSVGDVYVSDSKGATYTIVDRDAENTTVSVKYNNGDTVTKTTSNAEFDNTFFKTDGIVKIEAENGTTTAESVSGNKKVANNSIDITNEDISLVVDAMNETLREGAEEGIYEGMPPELEKSLDTFAKSLIKAYNKVGNIGNIAKCFTDGGAKVIAAIDNLSNKTVVKTKQNTEEVLQNQSKSATIKEKTTKTEPDADKSHTVAYTNDNERIELKFKVVSVDDLIVSNSLDGKVNPNYPQELQPRDRSRTSSQSQIRQMAANLNPARLEESTSVSEGSPIIGPDNVVESGNGRTLAIELAYKNGTADEYRQYIINNADQYGIDASNLPERPVLVRERITEVDRTEFTRKANESSIGSLSATEQAKVDAEKLTEDVLNLLVANDDGIINTSDNHNFISTVITKVFKNEDLNNVVGVEGRLSARGLERITNAIFYKAYGDASLSARLSESLDNDMKNATKVLLNIAPRIVSIKNGIASGSMYDFDFSTDIVSAIKLFEKCRNENSTIENYAAQESLFEKESTLVMELAYVFEIKNRGAKQATDFYNLLLDTVTELGNPNQISLDIIETFQTKGEIFNATVEKFNNRVEPKNAITISENIYRPESEKGRENDRRGIDEVSWNESNENEKTENAVGVQPDNRRGKETGVVANDEQLRQANESIERQSEVEREDNSNEQIGSYSISENSRRGNNGSTRKQVERISYFERKNKGRNATERKNFARELIKRGQAEEVTQKIGKYTYKYTLVKPEHYNDDMLAMVEEAKAKGVELGFFISNARVNFDSKDNFLIDGIKISDSQILVQYDEDISPQKLFKHELIHAKWKTRTIQPIKNTILNSLTKEEKQAILSQERYNRYMKIYKNENIVLEEYVCDVMSGMNDDTANYIDVVADYWYGSETVDSYSPADYTTSTDAGGKNTETNEDYNGSVRFSAKTKYNEYNSFGMKWAYSSSTEIGDLNVLYKPRIKKYVLVEATKEDVGFIELKTGTYKQLREDEKIYESNKQRDFADNERDIDTAIHNFESGQNHNTRSNVDVRNRGTRIPNAEVSERKSESNKTADTQTDNGNLNDDIRFSLSKDSDGNTLTEAQQEYFKDSKVRDENGNLLVMYHGTPEDFTVFDKKKARASGTYGRGFYFTREDNHAKHYGEAKEYYLKIDNPLSTKDKTITKEQLKKFLEVVAKDEDYGLENYGYGSTVESLIDKLYDDIDVSRPEYRKTDFSILQDVNITAIGNFVEAVELFNKVNGTNFDGFILPTETVIFNSEQAKLTSNEKPTSNPDIRFSLTKPVEETKNLIAVHNLSPAKLLKTLKLGGLPMPSIAITRAKDGYNLFGDISLVFNKDTIDPQLTKRNRVFSGDAWTPTYPQVAYKLNEKAQNEIKKKIDGLVPSDVRKDLGGLHLDITNMEDTLNRNGNDMAQAYRYNYAMKYAFLMDNDVNIELPTKEKPFYRYGEVSNSAVASFAHKMVEGLKTVNSLYEQHSSKLMEDTDLLNSIASVLNEDALSTIDENSEAYQELVKNPLYKAEDIDSSTVLGMLEAARKYFHSNGQIESEIDYRNSREKIDNYFDSHSLEPEYEHWLKTLFSDIVAKEGIRNNKDLYTPSGNRRSFEALHYEHTLENVIKAMKEDGVKGIGGFGGGNIFGASTTEYDSVGDIKADAQNRMEQLPESKYDEIKKGFSDRFFDLANSLPIHKDSFSAIDDAANMLIEAVSKFKTKSGMANYLRTESQGWANYNDNIVDELMQLVSEIRQMPVSYFEAKPQRAVGFDEIKAVIMPEQSSYEDDLSEVKDELAKFGVPILEYEYGDNNARLEALNSLEDVRFSVANDSYAPTFYSQMGKTIDEMKQDKIGANSVVSYLTGRGVKAEEIKWSGIESFLDGKKSVTKEELQEFVANNQLQIEEITLDNTEIPYTQEQTSQINEYENERNEIFEELKREWKKAIGTDFPMQNFGLGLESSVVNLLMETDRQFKESADSGKEMVSAREQLKTVFENDDFGYDSKKEAYMYAVRNPYDFMYGYELTEEQKTILERFASAKEKYKNAEGIPVETQRHLKDIAAKSDAISRKISRIKSDHNEEISKHTTKWSQYTLEGGENYREIVFTMPDSIYTNDAMSVHWRGSIANGKSALAHARIQDFNVDGGKMLFIEEIQSDWHNEGHKKGYSDRRVEELNKIFKKMGKALRDFDNPNHMQEAAKLREDYTNLENKLISEGVNTKGTPDAPFRNNYHEFVLKNLIRMAAEQGYDSIGWTTADIQSKRWSDEYAEGYRIEYDQEIPQFLTKYGKKWGAKVGRTWLTLNEDLDEANVWTMPITDSMKESVLYEGQARYSLATDGILDLEDLWSDAIEEYGTIPKGEIPARDVDVPKKINKKDVVSRFARTMMEAGVTPDETVSEFEKAILDGTMTHEVITNKNASERAKQLIKHLGFEGALKQWFVLSEAGKVGKNELALGMELYNQCITNKDVHNAMKLAAELVAEATRAGQTLQATRMLKRMTPDGQLYYLEKSIQKMNEEFKEKLGDKYKDIELDEDLMEEFLTEKDEKKRNEIYDKICQNIADQIPATKLDKWNSWRYLAMLGNPRTHLRNIFGNAVFIPALKLKNYIGAVAEKAAKVNTSDRTKSLRKSKDAVEFAKKDVEEMIKVLQGENAKYAVTSDIQGKRTIFKTRWLEKLRLKNFDFLEREDMWFLKYHYTDALARLITARNIDVNSITPQMLEQLRAYAVKEAQAATYRDANALAEGLNRLQKNLEHSDKKSIRASGILLEGVMPFKKTPMNIAKQGINYSPIGIIKGTYKALTKLKTGETTVTDVIDDLSKGLSGTMVMMLGYFLASMGWLGGDEDKSKKEKEFDKMVGEQSYALNIGDAFSYTIDWMTPSNLSLFIGAKLHDLTKDDFEFADVVGALSTVTEPLLELSVFSGLNGVIESAQYSDSEALLAIGSDMITSYLMQGLPTIGGQISRIVDQSKREYYYTDKNSVLPQGLQRLIGQASSKIPFASYLFQPAIDEWGREEKYGNVVERVLENTVSPGYYSAKNYTEVDKELKELHERTGDDSVLPVIQQKKYTEDSVNYYMRAEDYTEAKKIRGQKSFELVNELLSNQKSVKLQNKKTKKYQNKRYSQMSDDEKVRAIQKCYEEAGDYTKEQMLEKVKSKSK